MKLFVATHNQHKIREISQILPNFEIVADDPEGVEETAPDFAGNALIKVRAIAAKHAGDWCLADDSGLEVRALGGDLGVRSARYAGEPSNTPNNNALLLKNLAGVADRSARFCCCCALVGPDGREHVVEGHCPGRIAETASGVEGFGYDPLFIPDGHDKSFAELSADEKNAISHRGRALAEVEKILHPQRSTLNAQRSTFLSWMRLFRIVNLPTVPGDVLVGAAAAIAAGSSLPRPSMIAGAAVASSALYLYGLVDNDLVGAATDRDRPIPNGEISPGAARFVRGLCWGVVLLAGALSNLPPAWWAVMLILFICVAVYNRTKKPFLMGLCRGLNVACGAAVPLGIMATPGLRALVSAGVAAAVWTVYIGAVTTCSEGEELSPEKKRSVGALIGALVYLQLAALLGCYLVAPMVLVRNLLIVGAVLLIVLRIFRKIFPSVSAS